MARLTPFRMSSVSLPTGKVFTRFFTAIIGWFIALLPDLLPQPPGFRCPPVLPPGKAPDGGKPLPPNAPCCWAAVPVVAVVVRWVVVLAVLVVLAVVRGATLI